MAELNNDAKTHFKIVFDKKRKELLYSVFKSTGGCKNKTIDYDIKNYIVEFNRAFNKKLPTLLDQLKINSNITDETYFMKLYNYIINLYSNKLNQIEIEEIEEFKKYCRSKYKKNYFRTLSKREKIFKSNEPYNPNITSFSEETEEEKRIREQEEEQEEEERRIREEERRIREQEEEQEEEERRRREEEERNKRIEEQQKKLKEDEKGLVEEIDDYDYDDYDDNYTENGERTAMVEAPSFVKKNSWWNLWGSKGGKRRKTNRRRNKKTNRRRNRKTNRRRNRKTNRRTK